MNFGKVDQKLLIPENFEVEQQMITYDRHVKCDDTEAYLNTLRTLVIQFCIII